ncbi:MAG: sensor histidine kinase [Campylobacterota bacterium]|nr:sensor histidine kinase [Campylobacterota bacterium]
MNKNYKIVFLIVLMLLLLTLILSVVNYQTTLKLVHKQIEEQSLPLSLDNIYTDIQENILEPYLITSMMSNDTFVKEWILQEKEDAASIQKYLTTIKEEYGLLSAILVSDRTKNYYTQDGFLETLSKNNRDNSWYFRFKKSQVEKEINIDKNEKIDSSYIMFMNNKIFDENHKLIGMTSSGVRIDSIHKMLQSFIDQYHLKVYIYDKDANIVLGQDNKESIYEIDEFRSYKKELLSKNTGMFEYILGEDRYIVNKKYIKELDVHILVKAKVKDFTASLESGFYRNLFISFLVTLFITLAIVYVVRSSLVKLEHSNEQKDVLLREVHHRVKNNLNIIGSMLGLQAMQEDAEIQMHLLKSKSRIDAISAVHEMLYKQENLKEINFCDYVRKIESLTSQMVRDEQKFTLDVEVDEECVLPLDIMIQFGLMISEMFTNTLKYAKNPEGLEIEIVMKKVKNEYNFSYRDNGVGDLKMDEIYKSKGLGTKLINICAKQLNGDIYRSYEDGLKYELSFKSSKI